MAATPIEATTQIDPVLAALASAPVGSAETDEEARLMAAAEAGGSFVRGADVERKLAERARREG